MILLLGMCSRCWRRACRIRGSPETLLLGTATVKSYVNHRFPELGVTTRAEAIALVLRP